MTILLSDGPALVDEAALLSPPQPRSWAGVGNGRRRSVAPVRGAPRGTVPAPRTAQTSASPARPLPQSGIADRSEDAAPAGTGARSEAAAGTGAGAVPEAGAGALTESAAIRKVPRRPGRARRLAGELLLTLTAVLGLLMTVLTVTAALTGLKPLVVRSGSMEPAIPTGAIVLVQTVPAAEIRVGDVVAVDLPGGNRVTHRVIEVRHDGDLAEVVLKGDANDDPDREPLVVDDAGRLVWVVPAAAGISTFLTSAKGGFVLGCIVTGVAFPVLRRRP